LAAHYGGVACISGINVLAVHRGVAGERAPQSPPRSEADRSEVVRHGSNHLQNSDGHADLNIRFTAQVKGLCTSSPTAHGQ